MHDIYKIIAELRNRAPDERFALATLVRTEGSSYRRPGARMLICPDGRTVGSLSGGCLEEEVVERGREILCSGEAALMHFDTRKRFGCDGKIDIFVEAIPGNFFETTAIELKARRSAPITTTFPRGIFEQTIDPPIRLLIFGEGPDSGALHRFSAMLGWEPVDLGGVADAEFAPDQWTAAIVKTHNYGRDFAILQRLLPLNLRYLGLIGPRQRRDRLMNDLLDAGITINPGFFSPAGLDLGGETPEQIALEIVSEIQRVLSGSSGASLRERKVPIHSARSPVEPVVANIRSLGRPGVIDQA